MDYDNKEFRHSVATEVSYTLTQSIVITPNLIEAEQILQALKRQIFDENQYIGIIDYPLLNLISFFLDESLQNAYDACAVIQRECLNIYVVKQVLDGQLIIQIHDDGCGLEYTQNKSVSKTPLFGGKGKGVAFIESRAKILNAVYTLSSSDILSGTLATLKITLT